MSKKYDEDGVWRTVGGRKIFIKDGQDLASAMKESGKFSNTRVRNKNNNADADEGNGQMSRNRLLLKYKLERQKALAMKAKQEIIRSTFIKLKERHESAINELSKDKYGSGTYDISTLKGVNYNSGYQVTFSQIGDDYDADTYYNLCNEFLTHSSDKKICAGKFEGTPEISFNVKDRDTAISLAKKYNQISIWDWANADEIKTGGNGRRLGK